MEIKYNGVSLSFTEEVLMYRKATEQDKEIKH